MLNIEDDWGVLSFLFIFEIEKWMVVMGMMYVLISLLNVLLRIMEVDYNCVSDFLLIFCVVIFFLMIFFLGYFGNVLGKEIKLKLFLSFF